MSQSMSYLSNDQDWPSIAAIISTQVVSREGIGSRRIATYRRDSKLSPESLTHYAVYGSHHSLEPVVHFTIVPVARINRKDFLNINRRNRD